MGIANRIINVLVLLASIGAIVLAFMLFDKREEVVAGRNNMAQAISENSNKLSLTSTENPAKVKIQADEMAVSKGTSAVVATLKKFDDATKAIIAQRNMLAKEIVELAAIIDEHDDEEGEYDGVKASDLANVKTNKEKFEAVRDKADKVIELYALTREAYIESVKIFEKALKMSALGDDTMDPMKPGFDEINGQVKKMEQKVIAFYAQIEKINGLIPETFQVKDGSIEGDGYSSFLNDQATNLEAYKTQYDSLVAEVKQLKEDIEKLKAFVEEQKQEIEKLTAKNKQLEEEKLDLQKKVATLEAEIENMKKVQAEAEAKRKEAQKNASANIPGMAAAGADAPAAPTTPTQLATLSRALRVLEGKVAYADAKTGLVVLDIGQKNTVQLKNASGKMVDVKVAVPVNAKATVATNLDGQGSYVCRLMIDRVEENQSMASVVSGTLPKVGDVVFFSAADVDAIVGTAGK